MTHEDAVDLIRGGIGPRGGTWAELGAGEGTFTRALGDLLGPEGVVWAVDRSPRAVCTLRGLRLPGGADLRVREGDFTGSLEALGLPRLDGVLMANALHFVEAQTPLLRRISDRLVAGGRLLLVEYDRTGGNRWVPYPVPARRFDEIASAAGLSEPREIGRRRSAYWREMYAAVAVRPIGSGPVR